METVTKIAKVLDVPIDYLVNGTDGSHEEVYIEDQIFSKKIKLLNTLDSEERFVVNKVIDAMLTKKDAEST